MALKAVPEPPLIPAPRPTHLLEVPRGFSDIQQALDRALRDIAYRVNRVLPKDGSEPMTGPLVMQAVATVDIPAAADFEGAVIYDTTTNTLLFSDGSAWVTLPPGLAALPAGTVIQEVEATSTTNDTTTAATMQNSSLSGTITPLLDNSIIEVTVDFPSASAILVASSFASRQMHTEIRNTTNSVSSPEHTWGRQLVAASAVGAPSLVPVWMRWRYLVNSTAARTFTVRFRSNVATNLQAELSGATATATMVLREIKQ